MQILATDGGSIGGLEKHTLQLCSKLAEKHEVHILIDHHYKDSVANIGNIHFHYIDFSNNRLNPFFLFSIFKIIKIIQPEIVHAQGGKASKILQMLLPFIRVISVATIHGMKKNIRSYRRFTEVIVVSRAIADKFKYLRNVNIIYNGIEFKQNDIKINKDQVQPKKALAVGRLDSVKGFDQLIIAWQDINLDLDILGSGEEQDNLYKLILKLNIQHKVKLHGHKDVMPFLLECDFVIITSQKEGGPLVLAEALSIHRPVISTNVGMVPEFIPKKYISEGFTSKEINTLIKTTIRNYAEISKDFDLIFKKAETELNLMSMVKRTNEVYELAQTKKNTKLSFRD